MLKIYDGRDYFYQWDLNQRLIVDDPDICEVNFCNGTMDCTLACGVYEEDGKLLVNVPNVLLQSPVYITVFSIVKNEDMTYTSRAQRFQVIRRTKPEDYAYTETECLRRSLDERVAIIEADYLTSKTLDAAVAVAIVKAKMSGLFSYKLTDTDKEEIAYLVAAQVETALDPSVTSITVTEGTDGTVTIENTLDDGSVETIVVGVDESGNPASVTYNGTEIPVTWAVSE